MALINTVPLEKAEGAVKEGYDFFMEKMGLIPKPMEMISVSPALFEIWLRRIHYLSTHPKLSFPLLAHIRYLVAHNLNYSFCMDFNELILKKQGLEEKDIDKLKEDPSQALLEDNEKAMLAFVVNAIKDPKSVKADDIQNLRDLGWDDTDMVDALSQGVSMLDHSIMMEVFQMGQDCIVA